MNGRKLYREQKLERLRAKEAANASEANQHPLDPLSPSELERAVRTVQGDPRFRFGMRFGSVALAEPPKAMVLSGEDCGRLAQVIVIDNNSKGSYRLLIDLTSDQVTDWSTIEGQPAIAPDEFAETEMAVKMDGRVDEALRRRGLDLQDRAQVNVDPWSVGYYSTEDGERRVAHGLVYVKHDLEDNQYAHVVDGLSVLVDLNDQEVVAIDDEKVIPVPMECDNWAESHQKEFRQGHQAA